MNTMTRVMSARGLRSTLTTNFTFNRAAVMMTMLVILMLVSAFTVIYLKDLNRRLFIQYQGLQQVSQQYELNWSRLLLEQSTLSTQPRIQHIAQRRLSMELPGANQIVMVRE